jgi:hypothetical protein
MKMTHRHRLLSAGVLLLVAGCLPARAPQHPRPRPVPAPAPRVECVPAPLPPEPVPARPAVEASLAAEPDVLAGPCPLTVRFVGSVVCRHPGTVRYRLIRSDGGRGPVRMIHASAPGHAYRVAETWTLGGSYTGWAALEILSPARFTSNKAHFKVVCQGPPPPPGPVIIVPGPGPAPGPGPRGPRGPRP